MEEKSREQETSAREISLIRELAQIRKEYKRELEYEKFDGYELPPRTQFSMLNKPAVSIKYGVMKFNMACIRLFEGIKYVLPILHPNKKRLALIMCPEEDSAFRRCWRQMVWQQEKTINLRGGMMLRKMQLSFRSKMVNKVLSRLKDVQLDITSIWSYNTSKWT